MSRTFKRKAKRITDKLLEISAEDRSTAKIEPIYPGANYYPYAVNGLWLFIACPGSGKTHTYFRLCNEQQFVNGDIPPRPGETPQEYLSRRKQPFFETVALCSKMSELDKTVQALSPAITKSEFITINEDRILDWLANYQELIIAYNSIMKFIRSGFTRIDKRMQDIINSHALNKLQKIINFLEAFLTKVGWEQYPHRLLLILDDAAHSPLLKQKDGEMMGILRTLRHLDITVIVCIQGAADTPRDIKRLMTDGLLFPGIAREDFLDLISKSRMSWKDPWEAWGEYSRMTGDNPIYIVNNKGTPITWVADD
jgi:hypothetical protein